MKNGYYLSAYIHIGEIAHLLHLNVRHDQNIALWQKDEEKITLVHYWELERYSGNKGHYRSFYNKSDAIQAINTLLSEYDLTLDDMNEVWGSPQISSLANHSYDLDNPIAYHSISHLFSSLMLDSDRFYSSTIIGMAVDGGPDNVLDCDALTKKFYAGCVSIQGRIEMFPVYSPGMLWDYTRHKYKMREGTLMALGSASKSRLLIDVDELLLVDSSADLFKRYEELERIMAFIDALDEEQAGSVFNYFDEQFSVALNKISMFVKVLQSISYKIIDYNLNNILSKYDLKTEDTFLAMAGGFGLNCPTNSLLMENYRFKGFIGPPCINDSGLSLGIGLYSFYSQMGNRLQFKFRNAYYGSPAVFDPELFKQKYGHYIKSIQPLDMDTIVEDIINEPIVWMNGRTEVGPRALGNRSLLADPRTLKSKDVLNVIKKREWWRPVAPIVLYEDLDEWFVSSYESPYMLNTFMIREEKMKDLPSIAHLDNSARIQSLKEEDNPLLYQIISSFKRYTGVPIICNTSLNDNEEPIINTADEGMNFALRKQIQVMYINGYRFELVNHNDYDVQHCEVRPLRIEKFNTEAEREALLEQVNPHGISKDILTLSYLVPELHLEKHDITDPQAAKQFVKISEKLMKYYSDKIDLSAIIGD